MIIINDNTLYNHLNEMGKKVHVYTCPDNCKSWWLVYFTMFKVASEVIIIILDK